MRKVEQKAAQVDSICVYDIHLEHFDSNVKRNLLKKL